MTWGVIVDSTAEKFLRKIPKNDVERIKTAIDEFVVNPYVGDIEKMEGEIDTWRRRVGSYRIFYEVRTKDRIICVFKVKRRTSSTY